MRRTDKSPKNGIMLFSAPLIIVLFALIITFAHLYKETTDNNIKYTHSIFSNLAKVCETRLSSFEPELYELNAAAGGLNVYDPGTYAKIREGFIKVYGHSENVDSVFLYAPEGKIVITEQSAVPAEQFFKETENYNVYTYDYWRSFRFYRSEKKRVLSPDRIISDGGQRAVVPVVYNLRDAGNSTVYAVINVDINYLIGVDTEMPSLDNSELFILSRYSNEIFPLGSNETDIEFTDEFYDALNKNGNSSFKFKLNVGKSDIIVYTNDNSLTGYLYFSVTPIKKIYRNVIMSSIWQVLLFSLLLTATVIYVLKNFFLIQDRLEKLKKQFTGKSEPRRHNILEIIDEITSSTQNARNMLNVSLPHAQEKLLYDMLTESDIYVDDSTREMLFKSLDFSYNYFAVVMIQISPTAIFHDRYNYEDYNRIRLGFYEILNETFSASFKCYIIPIENDIMNIILNMESEKQLDEVHKKIEAVYDCFRYDIDCITLYVGVSKIHRSLKGLKAAYAEAKESFYPKNNSVSGLSVETPKYTNVSFDLNEENTLFNALCQGDNGLCRRITDDIIAKNANLTESEKKYLYNYILSVLLRAVKINNISPFENKLDYEIINGMISADPSVTVANIYMLIDYITENAAKNNAPPAERIIEFINENYCSPDLSLKYLADEFSLKQSSLSAILKLKLETGFHKYLTGLRIEKAKELLLCTDKNIEDIYPECGFVSKQTFFRTFKNEVKMPPAEYRKLYKK